MAFFKKNIGADVTGFDGEFFHRPALELAPSLIGHYLLVADRGANICGGRILEAEAYHQDDPASHSYAGINHRNQWMFEDGGIAYVYRSYGIHWCFNIVCGQKGVGEGVLIRALEPLWGIPLMNKRRGPRVTRFHELCNGPGKLCQSLGIVGSDNGQDLREGPILVARDKALQKRNVVCTTRVGITKAVDNPWRFLLSGHPAVSLPKPRADCSTVMVIER